MREVMAWYCRRVVVNAIEVAILQNLTIVATGFAFVVDIDAGIEPAYLCAGGAEFIIEDFWASTTAFLVLSPAGFFASRKASMALTFSLVGGIPRARSMTLE